MVLRSLEDEACDTALVNVNTKCRNKDDRHTHAWRGLSDEENVIREDGENHLLTIKDGESVIVFFCEHASKITYKDGELSEERLSKKEDAFERARAVAFEYSLPWAMDLPQEVRKQVDTLCETLEIDLAE